MRRGLVCLGIILASWGFPAGAQENRERVEAEAISQAAEADRLFKAGDFAAALPLYLAERGSRAALGDLRYEAYALRAIGCCRSRLGDDDTAIAAWQAASKLDARRDDSGFEGYDWLLIGQAHLRRGRPEDAIGAITRALPKLSKAVDRDHEADARLSLADALFQLDRSADTLPHLGRAETLARELNDPRRLALAWLGSSLAARATGAPGLAAERAEDARRSFEAQKSRVEQALACRALGEALADLDRLDAAVEPLEEAARTHEKLGDPSNLADDLMLLAAVRADSGDPRAAVGVARRVVQARRLADDPSGEIEGLVALANYQEQAGDRPGSSATLGEALTIARREATPPARLVPLLLLSANLSRRDGQTTRADALMDEADRLAAGSGDPALRRLIPGGAVGPEQQEMNDDDD